MNRRDLRLRVLSVGSALLSWEIATRLFVISEHVVPSASRVAEELWNSSFYLTVHSAVTLLESTAGFGIGVVAAITLGIPIALSSTCRAIAMPHVLWSQAIPKAALAPLLLIWLGYSLTPKIVLAAVSSFLPLLTGVVVGLSSQPAELLELFDALSATRWERLVKLRIPVAVPYFTASLQMGALYSLLGAITSEFVNSDKGLGYVLIAASTNLNTPLLFAAMVCASMMGIVVSGAASHVDALSRRHFVSVVGQ